MKDCTTSAQWLQYVGAFDANRKLVLNDWGEQLQHLMHRKSPHIELKKIDAQKDSKSSKASHRRKNRKAAAQAERQAKKELRGNKAKDLKTNSYPVPDRFKAFTIGDRHLVFDKAQRKPSEGSNAGYDGLG